MRKHTALRLLNSLLQNNARLRECASMRHAKACFLLLTHRLGTTSTPTLLPTTTLPDWHTLTLATHNNLPTPTRTNAHANHTTNNQPKPTRTNDYAQLLNLNPKDKHTRPQRNCTTHLHTLQPPHYHLPLTTTANNTLTHAPTTSLPHPTHYNY